MHALLLKLQPLLAEPLHPNDFAAATAAELLAAWPGSEQTLCTVREGGGAGGVRLRAGRPGLVVSSTSWTPDEDFGLLLKAAQLYDGKVSAGVQQWCKMIKMLPAGRSGVHCA
jgi:beta-1,4-mannosyltransferase